MDQAAKTIAVVIPVFNEEGNIDPLCARLDELIQKHREYHWQLIFVDDGSSDRTVERLARRQGELPITIICLSRNFGHQSAIKAGLDHADADAVVTLDGDLQHPPELIDKLLEKWQQGYKVVHAVRRTITPGGWKSLFGSLGYRIINLFAERPILPEAADFRLIDRVVADALKRMYAPEPILRSLVAWLGFDRATVSYDVQPRLSGKSSYSLRQMRKLLLSGIFDFSLKPLRFASLAGAVLLIVSLCGHPWLFNWFPSTVSLVLMVGALELFAMGLIAIYLGRAYRQSLGWPLYVIAEKLNFDK
jgi:dolichol-phosphate mannosyltransferase